MYLGYTRRVLAAYHGSNSRDVKRIDAFGFAVGCRFNEGRHGREGVYLTYDLQRAIQHDHMNVIFKVVPKEQY